MISKYTLASRHGLKFWNAAGISKEVQIKTLEIWLKFWTPFGPQVNYAYLRVSFVYLIAMKGDKAKCGHGVSWTRKMIKYWRAPNVAPGQDLENGKSTPTPRPSTHPSDSLTIPIFIHQPPKSSIPKLSSFGSKQYTSWKQVGVSNKLGPTSKTQSRKNSVNIFPLSFQQQTVR